MARIEEVMDVMCECGVRLVGKYKETGLCAKCTKEQVSEVVVEAPVVVESVTEELVKPNFGQFFKVTEQKYKKDSIASEPMVNKLSVKSEKELKLDDELNKEWLLSFKKQAKLDGYIGNAIVYGRTNKVKGAMNCITKGQIIAIVKNYKTLTNFDMPQDKQDKLKKLDGSQAHYVEVAIKQAQTKARQFDFNKRIAKANA